MNAVDRRVRRELATIAGLRDVDDARHLLDELLEAQPRYAREALADLVRRARGQALPLLRVLDYSTSRAFAADFANPVLEALREPVVYEPARPDSDGLPRRDQRDVERVHQALATLDCWGARDRLEAVRAAAAREDLPPWLRDYAARLAQVWSA